MANPAKPAKPSGQRQSRKAGGRAPHSAPDGPGRNFALAVPKRNFALAGLRHTATPRSFTRGGLHMTEQRRRAMVALNGGPSSAGALEAALQSLRLDGAAAPGCAVQNNVMRLLWHGPGTWLAVSETLAPEALCEKLQAAIGDTGSALIDLSHARVIVRLAGKAALDALATGCPVDAHAMLPNSSFASLFRTFNVLVDVHDAECVELYVSRSLGRALWDHLERITAEFAGEVAAD